MATVLFTWELGGGLGHVSHILPLARELARLGHRPVLALRNLIEPAPLLEAAGFPVLQAPRWEPRPHSRPKRYQARTFADLLAFCGFTDRDGLAAVIRAWDTVIETIRPALIVAEHSPMACVAAYGGPLPLVVIGTGFTVPPSAVESFPVLTPGAEPLVPPEAVFDCVAAVLRRRGRPVPAHLPHLFAGEAGFVLTYPELDPYSAWRTAPAAGPIECLGRPTPLPAEPRGFAYLPGDHPRLDTLLAALAESGLPGAAYVRHAGPGVDASIEAAGWEACPGPQPLADLLPRVSVVLHHGGLGMAAAALAAGRPQVLIPTVLEQRLNARAVEALGAGICLGPTIPVEMAGPALRQAATEPRYAAAAQAWAARLAAAYPEGALPRVAEACLRLLR